MTYGSVDDDAQTDRWRLPLPGGHGSSQSKIGNALCQGADDTFVINGEVRMLTPKRSAAQSRLVGQRRAPARQRLLLSVV